MSLEASMKKFRAEQREATMRNVSSARPSAPTAARTSTPKPSNKRPRENASAAPAPATTVAKSVGSEMFTHMIYARDYLRSKFPAAVAMSDVLDFLSLPTELLKHSRHITSLIKHDPTVDTVPKHEFKDGQERYRYRPAHPVTNAEELKTYLSTLPTAAGIPVKELRDGWSECIPGLEDMAKKHEVLLVRQKKDNLPKTVYADSPQFYVHMDSDFVDFWGKCKLPASEAELRAELEKANLTPTSQVKEIRKGNMQKREKKRANRRGGKTTNTHMMGILRDYKK